MTPLKVQKWIDAMRASGDHEIAAFLEQVIDPHGLIPIVRATKPDPAKILTWAHALRTTSEPQRIDAFMGAPGCGMCVLGVAFWTLDPDAQATIDKGEWSLDLGELLGAHSRFPVEAFYRVNDNGKLTFAQFADLLEAAVQ